MNSSEMRVEVKRGDRQIGMRREEQKQSITEMKNKRTKIKTKRLSGNIT